MLSGIDFANFYLWIWKLLFCLSPHTSLAVTTEEGGYVRYTVTFCPLHLCR